MRHVLILLLCVSCVRRNGQREVVIWEDRLRDLAGFQMNCDPDSLRVVDLVHQAGVSGCGQRRVYVWQQRDRRWVPVPDWGAGTPTPGAACDLSAECPSGLECADGRCVPAQP